MFKNEFHWLHFLHILLVKLIFSKTALGAETALKWRLRLRLLEKPRSRSRLALAPALQPWISMLKNSYLSSSESSQDFFFFGAALGLSALGFTTFSAFGFSAFLAATLKHVTLNSSIH